MALKILLLSHKFHPDIGGIETISELLAGAFANAGHEVHVLTWSTSESAKDFPFIVVRAPTLRRLFKEHAWADIVFENNPCLRLSWPSLMYGRPSTIVLQTWLPRNKNTGLISSTKQWWLKRASKVVAISEAVRQHSWPAAIVIANSYKADGFHIIPDTPRNKDFVFVGRLVSDKGADIAIKAFHILHSELAKTTITKRYSLTIIGDGPDKAKLEELVAHLQLQDSVRFTGALRDQALVICLNQHRFLLVPSVWEEPFGIVALEGMACGCVPIVSDGGGLPDAIGKAGLTFRRGSTKDLVRCMEKVLNNSLLVQQLRNEATDHLLAHHPLIISKKYLSEVEELVSYSKRTAL